MASYRDDTNEIAVARDSTWAGIKSIAESTARMRDVLLLGLGLMTVETAIGSDSVHDRLHTLLIERGRGSDQLMVAASARTLVVERARGADAIIGRTRTLIVEEAVGFDALTSGTTQLVAERGRGAETVIGHRTHRQSVTEAGKGRDVLIALQRQLVVEAGRASDMVLGRAHARVLVSEAATAADAVIDTAVSRPVVLIEHARGAAAVVDLLHARDLVQDLPAVAQDQLVTLGALIGQAWTAHADNWAMSRYDPFGFTGLAVIDGAVYATGPDGVYALDGTTEQIAAQLRTGKVDMTGGSLVNLVESHIEYELAGKAVMDVTLTQGGRAAKTYSYPLKARPAAAALTNARFEFGRGLAGRHFTYTLRLTGQHAYINDWNVLAAPSKRSV